jgi:ribosome-associated toxin RatA of RatAB toxin-antitoxin module
MPEITIDVRTRHDAAYAYERIRDFARYPELTDAVVAVDVQPADAAGGVVSEWTVRFRNGLLCWTERDEFDTAALAISFVQLSGDFATFRGRWQVTADGDGAAVRFTAEFDLGIPTLAALIDPVAEATLRSNILLILRGLLGDVSEQDQPPVGAGRA